MVSTGARPKQSATANPPITPNPAQAHLPRVGAARPESDSLLKPTGYGLPCANCRLYYPADLDVCPTCHHRGRVSPVVPKQPQKRAESLPSPTPDSAAVEQQREEFLRQFKSQHLEVPAEAPNAQASLCALTERHDGGESSAEICKECYQDLRERIDLCEAALHMNLADAAKIIYDAVWADPTDPNKTYENAAAALLTELRKRAAIESPASPLSPLPD